ncbi:HAMP domain-containing sensor histidine kinase [Nibribacter koreensis]|uniref:histidine kinase n=1 Tax=Nibribacter koreensis TaxID=1084519 RepID=A0ABP8F539_9BACT
MTFKNFEGRLLLRVAFLLVTLSLPVPVVLKGWSELLVFLVPLGAYQVYELVQFLKQAQEELKLFLEAVHYRDFSRYFSEKQAPVQLQQLRKGYNEINSTFLTINREKETQHQYLQKVLELVETGILSYDLDTGEVLMMNESFKKQLHIPYLKTIHSLAKRDQGFYEAVYSLQPGQTKIAVARTVSLEKGDVKMLLSATSFQNEGARYKLVAFQNVHGALDENEAEAWQKLLNVMTHEIMNSIAPISSLADTLKNRLQDTKTNGATAHDLEDLEEGITTIKHRSLGLLKFAETYRNLSKITTLNLEKVLLKDQFSNLQRLLEPTLAQRGITFKVDLKDPALSLQADPNLLDQVLINLVMNAMEAVKEKPQPTITLTGYANPEKKVIIKLTDNGNGMSEEVQEKIFIPFFTTKKTGSGIGLSLCKQIVLLHRGTIQVQSVEGMGTAFILRFG